MVVLLFIHSEKGNYIIFGGKGRPEDCDVNCNKQTHAKITLSIGVGFPSVCCKYHWLIKKLFGAYTGQNRAMHGKLN